MYRARKCNFLISFHGLCGKRSVCNGNVQLNQCKPILLYSMFVCLILSHHMKELFGIEDG